MASRYFKRMVRTQNPTPILEEKKVEYPAFGYLATKPKEVEVVLDKKNKKKKQEV